MFLKENSIIIITAFLSFFTLITGLWFFLKPPKKINLFFGYRTKDSMKNYKNWNYAHYFSGKLLILFSLILMIIGLFLSFIEFNQNSGNFVIIILFIIGVIYIITKTEKALTKRFNK